MPYGTINADVIQSSVSGVSLGAGNATRFKNRIINGNMVIDQRNAGASVTNTGIKIYSLDRWFIQGISSSKFTAQQNAGSVTPPAGFINYLGITSSAATSVGSGDYYFFGQSIEGLNVADLGWGTANAKTITLSAWVYSSLTGTFGGSLRNSAATRSYPFSYSIPTVNTWTQISVTIAGDTSGTWLTTNGTGIDLDFNLGSGSTLSGTAGAWATANYTSATGATSVVGTSGATFYITGVQLEVGSSATGFEYCDYTTQINQCYRYYQKLGNGTYGCVGNGIVGNDRLFSVACLRLNGEMRSAPTLGFSSLVATDRLAYDQAITSIAGSNTTGTTAFANLTHSAAGTGSYPNFISVASGTSGFLSLSSEL